MKNFWKKILAVVLALTALASLMIPTTFAAEQKISANAVQFASKAVTTYTGVKTKLELTDEAGEPLVASDYNWTTSNKKIVTVTGGGIITAQKTGTAKITATAKKNKKNKATITVTVKKNKVDNIYKKPPVSAVSYPGFSMLLKSVEIASPKKVIVEYYYIQNYPSSRKTVKMNYVDDEITAWHKDTLEETTIVDGKVKNIKLSAKGKVVKTLKVVYTGGTVKNTNICLKDMLAIDNDRNMTAQVTYRI